VDGASRAVGRKINRGDDEGCAYILDGGGTCGAVLRPGSPYCAVHHALCHVPEGSSGERRRLREAEALACAVGGKQGGAGRAPPDRFLRRLENVARGFTRPSCSRIVRAGDQ
jgi:hypothetical protein